MRTLSEVEPGELFEATARERLHGLWVLLASTALQIGEALALRWTDVDLGAGRLQVRRALERQQGSGAGIRRAEKRKESSWDLPRAWGCSVARLPIATPNVANELCRSLGHPRRRTAERASSAEMEMVESWSRVEDGGTPNTADAAGSSWL